MEKTAKKLSELTQTAFPFRTQKVELFEDRIELSVRAPFERYRIPFYLHSLKEEPDDILRGPWKVIVLCALSIVAGGLLVALGKRPGDLVVGIGLLIVGGLGLLGGLGSISRLKVYIYKTVGRDASAARYEPQFFLYPSRPNNEEVLRFEDLLRIERERQVEKARIENEEPILYARELERFAGLRKVDAVTEEEYALVKAKLLNIKPRHLGF